MQESLLAGHKVSGPFIGIGAYQRLLDASAYAFSSLAAYTGLAGTDFLLLPPD